jgi:iron complex transport system permease protein
MPPALENTAHISSKASSASSLLFSLKSIKTGLNSILTENGILVILGIAVVFVFVFSFTLGRYHIPLASGLEILLGQCTGMTDSIDSMAQTVILKIRLPRILAALLIGAAMALSGAAYQGMFQNPMVSPDILGASAGAGFGAAVAILFSSGMAMVQFSSFIFSLAAVGLTITITRLIGKNNNVTLLLVLSGMVVSTLFSSFISITKFVADPENKLPSITFWLMGGLTSVNSHNVMVLLVLLIAGSIPLYMIRWRLNILSFGDEEAQALGVDVKYLRYLVIISSTLLTASCVSICGLIGWIGLIIPHIARLLVGPNFRILIPSATLIGGVFLLAVDDIARCAFASEIPLGIITALIGAPFFLYLLMTNKKGWI